MPLFFALSRTLQGLNGGALIRVLCVLCVFVCRLF